MKRPATKRIAKSDAGLAEVLAWCGDDPAKLLKVLALMDELIAKRKAKK